MPQPNQNSLQYAILAHVAHLLQGQLCRMRPYAEAELPADNVIPLDEDPEYLTTDGVEVTHRFDVRHIVLGTDGSIPAIQQADTRYLRGYRLLLADPTLGGLVRRIKPVKRKWEIEQRESQMIALVVTYEVEFSTTRGDPSLPGY